MSLPSPINLQARWVTGICGAYAFAGSNEVSSHAGPKVRVRNCPLQIQLDYAGFVLRMSAQSEAYVSLVAVQKMVVHEVHGQVALPPVPVRRGVRVRRGVPGA